MDQVKAIGRVLLKHGFWIVCALIVLVSVGTWYTASGGLKKEFEANRTKIDGSFSTAKTLQSKANPPNTHSAEQMVKLNDQTLQLVLQAWQRQYSFQEQILRWSPRLGPDFVAAVRPLKPIELKVDFPTPERQKLKVDFRQRMGNYVKNLLPDLAKVVGAEWQVGSNITESTEGTDPTAAAVPPGTDPRLIQPGMRPPEKDPPLVVWSQGDQAALVGRHFDWSSQPDAAPTTLQVLYAQEDLWVLAALMHIIRKTNGDAESRHEAIVKTIETILIGKNAGARVGQIYRAGSTAAGGYGGEYGSGGYGEESSSYGEEDYATEGSSGEYGGEYGSGDDSYGDVYAGGEYGQAGPGSLDPGEGRYVNNEYKRLRAEDLRTALRDGGPDNAFLVVAKRMPIRMQLVIDGRKLHRLLAECGNSALPVEIRQVRVNRSSAVSAGGYGGESGGYGSGSGGYGSEMGGYGSEMGGMGGMGGFGGMGGGYEEESSYGSSYGQESYGEESYGGEYGSDYGGTSGDRSQVSSSSPYDVKIELFGIIYIYNPVDKDKLGAEAVTDSSPTDETTTEPPAEAAAAAPVAGGANS